MALEGQPENPIEEKIAKASEQMDKLGAIISSIGYHNIDDDISYKEIYKTLTQCEIPQHTHYDIVMHKDFGFNASEESITVIKNSKLTKILLRYRDDLNGTRGAIFEPSIFSLDDNIDLILARFIEDQIDKNFYVFFHKTHKLIKQYMTTNYVGTIKILTFHGIVIGFEIQWNTGERETFILSKLSEKNGQQ